MRINTFRVLIFCCINLLAGCLLSQSDPPDFADVQPIFINKCGGCHRDGGIGPMPLVEYADISAFGSMIKYVTSIGYMPPFLADGEDVRFHGDRRLSDREVNMIAEWIDGGMTNMTNDRVAQIEFPEIKTDNSADLVLFMSDTFEQYGVYYDQYRVFAVPTGLDRDTFVSAIQFVPGNRRIVRSASISVIVDSSFVSWDMWDPGAGYFSFGDVGCIPFENRWYTWTPGRSQTFYENDQKLYLPAGAILLFHIHYGPTATPQKDMSSVHLTFSEPSEFRRMTIPLVHSGVYSAKLERIKAGEKRRMHASFRIPYDMPLYGVMPHGHFLCRDWEIFVRPADTNAPLKLLDIKDWDFKWKQMFYLKDSVVLKQGDEIHVLATYDNTSENLLNPSDPPRDVVMGKRMFEEMMVVYFELGMNAFNNPVNLEDFPTLISESGGPIILANSGNSEYRLHLHANDRSEEDVFLAALPTGTPRMEIVIPYDKLEYGNYVLRLEDEKGDQIAERLVVFVDEEKFGIFK